jgi:hypothetical protein
LLTGYYDLRVFPERRLHWDASCDEPDDRIAIGNTVLSLKVNIPSANAAGWRIGINLRRCVAANADLNCAAWPALERDAPSLREFLDNLLGHKVDLLI